MKSINFVTGNLGKLGEVRDILSPFGIKVIQIRDDKPELQDSMENIVGFAAEHLSKKHRKTVVVEDAGLFLDAYRDFPGPYTKHMYHSIGFDGFFRLLEGKKRAAEFRAVVGFCKPGKKPVLFTGVMRGRIAMKAEKGGHEQLPYDRIFIADGYSTQLCKMLDQKNFLSHRRKAFEKLGRWLS